MIICKSRGFLFMKPLKSGGTSVEIALRRLLVDGDIASRLMKPKESRDSDTYTSHAIPSPAKTNPLMPHMCRVSFRGVVDMNCGPDAWDRYKRITIRRNPFAVAESMYRWVRHESLMGKKWRDCPWPAFAAQTNHFLVMNKGMVEACNEVIEYRGMEASLNEMFPGLGPLPRTKDKSPDRDDLIWTQEQIDDAARWYGAVDSDERPPVGGRLTRTGCGVH